MVRVSSPAKLRPWSELTAKMVMGVVPGLVKKGKDNHQKTRIFRLFRAPGILGKGGTTPKKVRDSLT